MIPFSKSLLGKRAHRRVLVFVFAAAILPVPLTGLYAQAPRKVSATTGSEEELAPFKDFRGVQLGMTADEVRKKLGSPKDKGEEQDFYMFTETEMLQIVYDKTRKVTTISADFMAPGNSVPTAKQVFGAEVEAKADGSVNRMVRYPKAGYWISYNRTGGDAPLTTITCKRYQ